MTMHFDEYTFLEIPLYYSHSLLGGTHKVARISIVPKIAFRLSACTYICILAAMQLTQELL